MTSCFKLLAIGISCVVCYEIVVAYAALRDMILQVTGIGPLVDVYVINPTMAIVIDAISLIGLMVLLGSLIVFVVKALN